MAADNEVNIKFGATITDLKSKMDEVFGIFGQLTQRFAALAAVVAGGAAFKSFIDAAVDSNSEAMKLSKTLGMTGDDAGVLNVALKSLGIDTDTYTGAFLKFNRQLKSNSEELRAMGVDVDAVKNGTKSSNDVFLEAIGIVTRYAPGIDQTQAAMRLFGRSVEDVQKLAKLMGVDMDAMRQKTEALGLSITQEGVEATKKYKLAMADVGLVMEGLKKTIGEAVLPLFTESAQQLASWGPTIVEAAKFGVDTFVAIWRDCRDTLAGIWDSIVSVVSAVAGAITGIVGGGETISAMEVFKNALSLVQMAFIAFRVAVQEVVNFVSSGLRSLVAEFTMYANVAGAALRLDFAGAKAAFKAGIDERNRILEEGAAKAVAIAKKGGEDFDAAAFRSQTPAARGTPAGMPKGGTQRFTPTDKNADKTGSARLALARAEEEADLALQREYLKEAQSIYDDAYKNGLVSTQEYYDAKLAIEMRGLEETLATKRRELEEAEKSASGAAGQEQKLKFQAQAAKLQGEINILTAQEANAVRANTAARQDAEQKLADQLNDIRINSAKAAADDEIATEKRVIAQKLALGQINAQQSLEQNRQLEDRAYQNTLDLLAARRAAIRGTDDEIAKQRAALDASAEQEERSHQQRLTEIANAAELEREKYSIGAQQSIRTSFATMIEQMLSGTQRLGDILRNFGKAVEQTFLRLISQKFTEQLFDATGANQMINSMVSFLMKGLEAIGKAFVRSEGEKLTAEKAGVAARMGAQQIEKTAQAATAVEGAVAVQGAEAMKTSATVAGVTVRETAEEGAAATSTASTASTAIANIGAKAWEAAASVYASIAAIPYVGPFLAPAMAIAAGVAVLGFASRIASSAGGEYQVPEDRLNFVHKDETILPARFASGLRNMIDGGPVEGDRMGAGRQAWKLPDLSVQRPAAYSAAPAAAATGRGGRGGSGPPIVLQGHTAGDFFIANKHHLQKALSGLNRDFAMVGRK